MPKRNYYPCDYCGETFNQHRLIRWLEAADTLSPRYCKKCYGKLLDEYQEGYDIEDLPDDSDW